MYNMTDYENVFLASIVKNPSIIDNLDIPEYVFFTPDCIAIYKAILEAKQYGQNPDLIMISEALGRQGNKKLQGFLARLEVPDTPVNHFYYLNALIEYSRKRDIRQAIGIMSEAIEDPSVSSVELADKALETISDALQKTAHRQVPTIGVLMPKYIDEINKRCNDHENGVSETFGMGFGELDTMIGPLLPGEMIIVAARPGCGKSSFALQVADHVASNCLKPAAYFSLEMTTFDMLDRLLAVNKTATVRELRTGVLNPEALGKIVDMCEVYYKSKISIYEGSPTVAMLHSRIRREVASRGTKLFVVDYLGLIDGLGADGAKARWEKVGEESRALKRLALELHVVIMVCVQLGRDADGSEPSIAMLRDSGALEQDADRILLLYHSGKDEEEGAEIREVTFKVGKNRHGAIGKVVMKFDGPHTRFESKNWTKPSDKKSWEGMGAK